MKKAFLMKGSGIIEISFESQGPKMLSGCKFVALVNGWSTYVPSRIHFEEVEFTWAAAKARAIAALHEENVALDEKMQENFVAIHRLEALADR